MENFAEAQQKWAAAKEACLELLYQKTDHEARKLADLARSYTTAEKAMKDLSRPLKNPPAGLTSWEASAAALFGVIASGAVKIRINQRYALADAARAHADLEARKTTGSTVLMP